MARIIISTNASLDGVVQDPTGEEGFDRGGWFGRYGGADLEAWNKLELDEALAASALLLGRRSDEWFAQRWLPRDGAFADRLNGMPKYVVSSTPRPAAWSNATVLTADQVPQLRQELDGDVLVYASYQLGHTLLERDLVDEVRLTVFPVVLGAGRRLFGETTTGKPLHLADSRRIGDGLAFLTYRTVPAR